MADDLEAAFADSLNKIKSGDNEGNSNKFQMMGLRGEAYKRVADALQDKAKFSRGKNVSMQDKAKFSRGKNVPMEDNRH